MRRIGVARVIQRANYKPWRVARRVRAMLAEPEFDARARGVAEEVAREDGVKTACDALENLYARQSRRERTKVAQDDTAPS
jgi:UDP:flavonoid glycosyltransferase YjiC (YdhE family)